MLRGRVYSEQFHHENLPDVRGRVFRNALFSDCKIGKISGAKFLQCVFYNTEFTATDPRDILGVDFTLDCLSFSGIKMSAETLDALIFLLSMTTGNDDTRGRLMDLIDYRRLRTFQKLFPHLE